MKVQGLTLTIRVEVGVFFIICSYGVCLGGKARFSYYAPSYFKVMLVTEDGSQYVSNEITTTRFTSLSVIYQYIRMKSLNNSIYFSPTH